jgi:hypothetical protein
VTFIAIYVNYCLVTGTDAGIDNVINNLKDHNFGVKVNHNSTDYLSCRVRVDYENKTTFMMQPHSIKTLEKKIGEEFNNFSEYGTPGTLRSKSVRHGDNIERIESNLQARYISGVGMLLWEYFSF